MLDHADSWNVVKPHDTGDSARWQLLKPCASPFVLQTLSLSSARTLARAHKHKMYVL